MTGLLMGGFGALATRAPPELEPWRMAFLGLAVCFLLVANSVPPTVFQNESFWLWAGVLWSARVTSTRGSQAELSAEVA